jgi:threonine/homoserine/homoserine lactone efflux protein
MLFSYLVQGLGLGLSASATPGPYQAYLISQALKNGWRRTLPAALAPLLSDAPIIALVLFVLAQLPPIFLRVVQIAGGLFLLYLAWGAFQSFRNFTPVMAAENAPPQSIWKAVLMNMLSPGPYIYWSLISGPILVSSWKLSPGFAVAFLGGFYSMLIGGSGLLIIVFGAARHMGPSTNRFLLGFSALALLVFGLYQLWDGVFV